VDAPENTIGICTLLGYHKYVLIALSLAVAKATGESDNNKLIERLRRRHGSTVDMLDGLEVRHTYIAGPRVFRWPELVDALEKNSSVDLIERDFGCVDEDYGKIFDADLVLDEATCIL
jgi:hypothetical protein